MTFADLQLAQRLEGAQATYAAAGASAWRDKNPSKQIALKEIGGGWAVFLGADSPLTHVVGIGMNGQITPADLDRVEDFYRGRDTSVKVDVCPLADPSLIDLLGRRGYRPVEFANVLVRALDSADHSCPPNGETQVREISGSESELWSTILARGFFELQELATPLLEIGMIICNTPSTRCFVGSCNEIPAGGGGLACSNGIALLFADATLPEARNRGIHSALISARLAIAQQEGCQFATADTLPGSISQRHYERCGFRVAYTKMIMERDL